MSYKFASDMESWASSTKSRFCFPRGIKETDRNPNAQQEEWSIHEWAERQPGIFQAEEVTRSQSAPRRDPNVVVRKDSYLDPL